MNDALRHLDKPFVLCGLGLFLTAFLLWFGKLDAANFTAITIALSGAYVAGWGWKSTKGTPAERAAPPDTERGNP